MILDDVGWIHFVWRFFAVFYMAKKVFLFFSLCLVLNRFFFIILSVLHKSVFAPFVVYSLCKHFHLIIFFVFNTLMLLLFYFALVWLCFCLLHALCIVHTIKPH